jgi:hypothetical protein
MVKTAQVDPFTLLENPANWRIHPDHQKQALTDILTEIGWVDDVIVNINTGLIVDGHLRVWVAREQGEATIPVTYVDLTEDEEALILSVLDPIAELAQTDEDALIELKTKLAQAKSFALGVLYNIAQARTALQVDVKERKERGAGNTMLRIGSYTIKLPRDVYLHWREQMYQTISFDRKQIVEEMRRRLGL